jgi:hypothetical protein
MIKRRVAASCEDKTSFLQGVSVVRFVRCGGCGWTGERHRTGDGTFGPCCKCGRVVEASTMLEARRIARAKADLAAFDAETNSQ